MTIRRPRRWSPPRLRRAAAASGRRTRHQRRPVRWCSRRRRVEERSGRRQRDGNTAALAWATASLRGTHRERRAGPSVEHSTSARTRRPRSRQAAAAPARPDPRATRRDRPPTPPRRVVGVSLDVSCQPREHHEVELLARLRDPHARQPATIAATEDPRPRVWMVLWLVGRIRAPRPQRVSPRRTEDDSGARAGAPGPRPRRSPRPRSRGIAPRASANRTSRTPSRRSRGQAEVGCGGGHPNRQATAHLRSPRRASRAPETKSDSRLHDHLPSCPPRWRHDPSRAGRSAAPSASSCENCCTTRSDTSWLPTPRRSARGRPADRRPQA